MARNGTKNRVVIAVPLATPFIYWKTVSSWMELEKPPHTELIVFQGSLVDRARNQLVEEMLHHPMKATHLFFLDGDVAPSPDTLSRLLRARQPIVAGVYRRRVFPHEPMAFLQKKGRLQPISLKVRKGLLPVDFVGGGCLLIERPVFEAIAAPWFAIEWRGSNQLPEDFWFCKKARAAGFKILVDPSISLQHIEPMGIGTDSQGRVQFSILP